MTIGPSRDYCLWTSDSDVYSRSASGNPLLHIFFALSVLVLIIQPSVVSIRYANVN